MFRELKLKKWEKENLKTPEEKQRNLKIHKKETKKYRGIEYDLICLERDSGTKWVALESEFEIPKPLIFVLQKDFAFREDFLYYDSGMWGGRSIEYQWNKMDKIARQEIDELYRLYENSDEILKNKINSLTTSITNLKNFIKSLGSE